MDILGIAGIARAIAAIPDIGTRNSNRNSKYAAGIAHSRGILCTGSRVLACRACTQTCVRPTCAWYTVAWPTVAWPARPPGPHGHLARALGRCAHGHCASGRCAHGSSVRGRRARSRSATLAPGFAPSWGAAWGGGATTSVDPWQDRTDRTSARRRATKAEDRTAEDRTAAAAADTTAVGSTAADSVGAAETTNEAGGGGHSKLSLRHEARALISQLLSATGVRTRGRLAWADIAQASGRGREFTCNLPPLGRVGHVGCAKSSTKRARGPIISTRRYPAQAITPAIGMRHCVCVQGG